MTTTFLIIEDNPDVREVLSPMIEIWAEMKGKEIQVHEAINGQDAIEWIAKHGQPNWILLDVRMPIMNGPDFLQHMKSSDQSVDHKTLLLTGYADDLDEYLGSDALKMQHLRKPFLAPELFESLDKLTNY
ncbi:MAG: response regulator [Mariprofundaceae bacterium]